MCGLQVRGTVNLDDKLTDLCAETCAFPNERSRTFAHQGTLLETAPCFVPGLPHVMRIELRQALSSYQDYHMSCVPRCSCPELPAMGGVQASGKGGTLLGGCGERNTVRVLLVLGSWVGVRRPFHLVCFGVCVFVSFTSTPHTHPPRLSWRAQGSPAPRTS